ncbi:MAG: respiratory nitrate reductase subunit gamma [Elusimicrobiota bacterium]
MDIVRFMAGGVLPYVALAVFVGGMTYKIRAWTTLASPPMTLFPAPVTGEANILNTVQEAVLFKSLFKGDRVLWAFAWVFHAVLALIVIGHFRVVANVDVILMKLGMSEEAIAGMSSGVGGAAGVVILAAAFFLLARRFVVPRVAEITGASDYLALLLVAAIIITGNMMRFGAEHFDLALTRDYFAALATFSGAAKAAALDNGVFLVHMCLALSLVMVMPFSKLLHFGGIFFTHQLVRKH